MAEQTQTQKKEKTLDAQSLKQTAIEAVHSKVKKQMDAGLSSGVKPQDLIAQLLKSVQAGPSQEEVLSSLQELGQTPVDKPGTMTGLLPALLQAVQGKGFTFSSEYKVAS